MEEIRQRIKAKRGKLNVYNNRINQHQQKTTFRNNDGMFYKKLNGGSNNENTNSIPDKDENKILWGINKVHNKDAEWISNIKSELLDLDREQDIIIFKKDLKKMLQNFPHWDDPGTFVLLGHWIKALKSLYGQFLNFLNLCMQLGQVLDCMVWAKTVLIQKDLSKSTVPINHRPITCLPNIWKLLIGTISDKIYESLDGRGVLTEE